MCSSCEDGAAVRDVLTFLLEQERYGVPSAQRVRA